MPENNEQHSQQDRRLQSLVYELDKEVHALKTQDATKTLQITQLQGEISGLRASTASSFEVAAATKLIGEQIAGVKAELASDRKLTEERMSQLSKDVAGMRRVLLWVAATFAGAIIAGIKWGSLFQ